MPVYQFTAEVTSLDKYEYKIRAEEIKTLISQKKYAEAAKVADTIDWTRVKSVMMLCTVSDVYKVNRRFDDAKLLLEMANERHPSGRMILYSLCDLSIRMGDVVHAIEYYKDFVQIAPNDSGRYVLQYKIYEAQDVSLEERIAVLEELKKRDYRERWAYELAYLYHRVGLATKCVEECDELILWFGEGKYVMKAMELKTLHQPLSPSQQKKFDAYMMRRQGLKVPEELEESKPSPRASGKNVQKKEERAESEMDIQVKTMDVGKYNTLNLQKELAASMQEIMQGSQGTEAPVSFQEYRQAYQEPENTYGNVDTTDFIAADGIPADTSSSDAASQEAAYGESGGREYGTVRETKAAYGGTASEQEDAGTFQSGSYPGTEYENYLSQEYDGQISMVVPDARRVEKQITGQMNIEDIMREWENMKRENEEKRRQEIKQRVQEQTGALFRDFDETSRKGMLERLQKEERIPVERRERSVSSEIPAHTKIWAAEEVENALRAESRRRSQIQQEEAGKMNGPVGEEPVRTAAADMDRPVEAVRPAETEKAAETGKSAEELNPTAAAAAGADGTAFSETVKREPAATAESSFGYREPVQNTGVPASTVSEAEREARIQEAEPAAPKPAEGAASQTSVSEAGQAAAAVETEAEQVLSQSQAPNVVRSSVAEAPAEETHTAAWENETAEAVPKEQAPIQETAERDGIPSAEGDMAQKAQNEGEGREKAANRGRSGKTAKEDRAGSEARSMTGAEKRLFASFVPTKGAMKRLVVALDQLSLNACTGNLILTGDPGADTMDLAKNIVKDVKAKEQNFSGRVAKITGAALNSSKKQPIEMVEKLAGGALMIEKAGEISGGSAEKLLQALNQEKWPILVILLDTKRNIRKLLEEHPEMESFFNARFDVEALDNSTLVAYGCQYARMQEFAIDELGRLALHTRIEDMQTSDHIVTVKDVREIIDEAIDHATRKTPKHLMDMLFSRRYDDNDMIILHEGDFI